MIGNVPGGYTKHPDGSHKVYSLGSTVVVSNEKKGTQEFLQGHTNVVSCITISKDGKYIASGQVTHMGFQVRFGRDIINVWPISLFGILKREQSFED